VGRRAPAALEVFKMSTVLLFTLAILALFALATVAPKLVRLRIRFFKWIVLLVLAVALLFFGVATAWLASTMR